MLPAALVICSASSCEPSATSCVSQLSASDRARGEACIWALRQVVLLRDDLAIDEQLNAAHAGVGVGGVERERLCPGERPAASERAAGDSPIGQIVVGERQLRTAAYRHTFRLLLGFATERTGTPPSALDIADLDAPLIAAFLDHLQTDRHNTVATRNNRLAAIHSLFAYLALHHPEHANTIQRVLAIPAKRTEKNLLTYLTDTEVDALLAACTQATWTGRRDHAMLALTIQTGLRISELITLNCQDITLGT